MMPNSTFCHGHLLRPPWVVDWHTGALKRCHKRYFHTVALGICYWSCTISKEISRTVPPWWTLKKNKNRPTESNSGQKWLERDWRVVLFHPRLFLCWTFGLKIRSIEEHQRCGMASETCSGTCFFTSDGLYCSADIRAWTEHTAGEQERMEGTIK